MTRLLKALTLFFAVFLAVFSVSPPGWAQEAQENADSPLPPADWKDVYNPSVVRSLNVKLSEADYQTIQADETFEIEVPATFWLDGDNTVDSVTGEIKPAQYNILIRRKSATAIGEKISYRIDFQGDRWYDLKKLSLENGDDNNVVSEGLAWQLHRYASNVSTSYQPGLAAWTTLAIHVVKDAVDEDGHHVVESRPQGVYLNVEFVDKHFLRHRDIWNAKSTWLYKQDDIGKPELKEAPVDLDSDAYLALNYSPFQGKFADATPLDPLLEEDLNYWIDMDTMLRVGAVNAFTDNPDELFTKGKNFFWVDFKVGQRLYFPWDLDASIRSTSAGIYGTASASTGKKGSTSVSQNAYQSVILNHPKFRTQYNALLTELLDGDGPMNPEFLVAEIEAFEQVLTPRLLADPNNKIGTTEESIHDYFAYLKQWVVERSQNVLSQIQQNGAPAPRADY